MAQYMILVHLIIAKFTKFEVALVLRSENRMVDALENLASSALYHFLVELNVLAQSSIFEEAVFVVETQIIDL